MAMVKEPSEVKKEAFSEKEPVRDSRLDKYKDLLIEGETIREAYDIGAFFFKLYVVLFTNKRLIIFKKVPRNVIELDYKDIELVEYYTNVEWLKMFYSILIYTFLYLIWVNIGVLLEKLIEFIPPLEPLLYAGNFFGMNAGAFIPVSILFVAGTYFAGLFILSALGRLRILVYDQPPFDITTFYCKKTAKVIHTFSELSESYREEREKRRMQLNQPQSVSQPTIQPAKESKKDNPHEE